MSQRRAFTLIEMAIVLVIMGLLIGLTLPVVQEFVSRDKAKAGQTSIDDLREIIVGYTIANGHLPDPDEIATLGLPLEDPWAQNILYIPADELDDKQEVCHEDVTGTTLDYVETHADNATNLATIDNVAFILVSLGANQIQETNVTGTGAVGDPFTQVEYYPKGLQNTQSKMDDIVSYSTLDYLKGRVCTAGTSTGPIGAEVSFAKDLNDFTPASGTAGDPSNPNPNYVTIDAEAGTVTLGDGLSSDGSGCFWYAGSEDSGNCFSGVCDLYPDDFSNTVEGGVRIYFIYQLDGDDGSGWTFAIASANPSTGSASTNMCGGEMLGYSPWNGVIPDDPIYEPKLAVEFDFYQSGASYGGTDPNVDTSSAFDPHVALVFWGEDYSLIDQGAREDDNRHNTPTTDPANPGNPLIAYPDYDTSYADGAPYFYSTTDDYADDGQAHSMRLDIVITEDAGGNVTYDYAGCIDCDGSNDLTQDFNDFGDWTTGHSFHYSPPAIASANASDPALYHALMENIYFGWTVGNGSVVDRTITISDFGLTFR